MTPDIENQEKLIQIYDQMPLQIREIMQVAAVAGEMSRTNLIELARRLGLNQSDVRSPTVKLDKKAINQAIDSEVMEYISPMRSGGIQVTPLIQDYVYRKAYASGIAARVNPPAYQPKYRPYHGANRDFDPNRESILRKMRWAFYSGNWERWRELCHGMSYRPLVLSPFCQREFSALSSQFQSDFFQYTTRELVNSGNEFCSGFAKCAGDIIQGMAHLSQDVVAAAIDLFVAQGDLNSLKKLAARVEGHPEIEGCTAFLQGDMTTAKRAFELADLQQRKLSKKRTTELIGLPMVFYAILLLKENSPQSLTQLKSMITSIDKWEEPWQQVGLPLEIALEHQLNPGSFPDWILGNSSSTPPLAKLVAGWVWRWFFAEMDLSLGAKTYYKHAQAYSHCHLGWISAEFYSLAALASDQAPRSKKFAAQAASRHAALGTDTMMELIQPSPIWESKLKALEKLLQPGTALTSSNSPAANPVERLVWEARFGKVWIELTPFVQKLSNKGWGAGRKVALGRLYENWQGSEFAFLTEQDRSICKCLRQTTERNYYGYSETSHSWDQSKLASCVVGHPYLYPPGNRDETIQVTGGRPYLALKKSAARINLQVVPEPFSNDSAIQINQDGPNRYSIVTFSKPQRLVAELVSGILEIPEAEEDRVLALVNSLASSIDIQSELSGAKSSGEVVAASPQIVAQLTPYDAGLRAEFFVQPLGEKGPFCRPGVGAPSMLAHVDGKSLNTVRDLDAETKNLQELVAHCRSLATRQVTNDQTEWIYAASDDALEFVVELQALAEQGKVAILWPRGRSHEIAGQSSTSRFQVSVKKDNDWFAASGTLKVDNELSIDLMRLLDLASASPSRFVRLDDGRFLALTQELRQRIGEIAAFGTALKDKIRFSPVRAVIVNELFETEGFKTDKNWKTHVSRIAEADSIPVEVPSTLQADLRDYQREGFAWLKRLAHWNTGACLADDMGLGKTVQALALLVDRAHAGPQLVVAPASVGFNWESETYRFAPTLTPKLFRDCDRDEFFSQLQSGDLVIASYGLMQTEIDRFTAIQWNTVLLDEAQAIKNMATKRSQAVMQLPADFRLILTGTPMENHLGELWNLFRFVVPGLLGSQDEFRARFAIPIERDKCRATRNRLKKLIQPFLLRRTKSEVLAELPARSESVLDVELSPAESALYEALRLKALQRIEEAARESKSAGERHLQVLAELTRLRLACCHPELVGGSGIESTKLDLFRQKVNEIIQGHHKVLVFSQFVKHLAILRNELDQMGVSYQYLDGATPVSQRKQVVEDFQAGKGDVFLISLKAGGTGLNLTAADYVIHMDPWWNPAVEDQATDRAHRIGQQRPVHVYRLITKGTIEEKIVALHKTKRDLADSLLEGSDAASKITTEELIGLLSRA